MNRNISLSPCYGGTTVRTDRQQTDVRLVSLKTTSFLQPTYALHCSNTSAISPFINRLVGLVVKASASRAEDPGFESRLRQDFFGVESYQ